LKQRIFLDTNIIVDLFSQRIPFYTHAAKLFTAIEKGMVEANSSSLTFANLHYILRKEKGSRQAVDVLKKLRKLVVILPVDDEVIEQALDSGFNDFEDAIQYYTALAHTIPYFITRNIKDYKASTIPVMTAEEFLAQSTS
jgi:predicted nucleic acid-binding protein